MTINHKLPLESLLYCSAPMVNQSDLSFRLQTVQHGATSTWTQMYLAGDLNTSQDTLDSLLLSLTLGNSAPENTIRDSTHPLFGQPAPQIVQIAGNNAQELAEAARRVAQHADAIDLNLGCPQRHAEQGHYGAYLLPKQNWPLLAQLVSTLAQAVDVPITTKIRLTVPKEQTPDLAVMLARAGSSLVTLHPRFASSVRRRKGLADLDMVVRVKDALHREGLLRCPDQPSGDTAVVSNGNVRCWDDIPSNLQMTGASGVMVGETLLENPALFRGSLNEADRIDGGGRAELERAKMAREYLELRDKYEALDAPVKIANQHLQWMLGSIPCTPILDAEELAKVHRRAAFITQTIKRIHTEEHLIQFRNQHL
ncbi:related to tRNA dihydrouridine synthase [Melanopsichium pennsylvanicum]|uniref:tRNA-dihydrouridine synthase n=2 Tax=Melanopsichium pennsylvanicum TaxID=63383 RepID=A0AAJ5C2D7_9BASI|nr:related to tRNA dihydrouridine synthase [Melanopsichium pennsylvanicum 4]SNX81448.1 related to tRNA dihydrouridine synthase [Melanopsichium pennsylvanicum]